MASVHLILYFQYIDVHENNKPCFEIIFETVR